jgi:dienelactone hydrolase
MWTVLLSEPLLLSCAETDMTFPTDKRHRAEDILAEVKATYHVQVFSGVVHGWALRADLTDENARESINGFSDFRFSLRCIIHFSGWAKEESARSIIEWFKRFSTLKQSQTRL